MNEDFDIAEEGFEKLDVWRKAYRQALNIYRLFSRCRDFAFRDQACRAAVSVPSNIAEGYERNSPGDFIRFLNIAKGSNGELRTQLYLANEMGYVQREDFLRSLESSKEISAMLNGLIKSIQNRS